MPPRRRRRARRGRTYSLEDLLLRQPKSLRKDPQYRTLLSHYLASDRLRALRFGSRCFGLLDRAVVAPENLPHFYRTYRLPRDPFFPLFFRIKRSYQEERRQRQEAREAYILGRMQALPPETRRFIRFLGEWEKSLNGKGDYPYWSARLYPATKKQVRLYEGFGRGEWEAFFREYLTGLTGRYRLPPQPWVDKLAACALLGLVPRGTPPEFPSREEVLRAFRTLSLAHHPDRGGSADLFIRLQEAKERLCGSASLTAPS